MTADEITAARKQAAVYRLIMGHAIADTVEMLCDEAQRLQTDMAKVIDTPLIYVVSHGSNVKYGWRYQDGDLERYFEKVPP